MEGRDLMTMKRISTMAELEDNLKQDAVILFKHSSTCPISGAAFDEYEQFTSSDPEFPALYLVVQEDRELSQKVAENYHVKHESPQVILFKNGDVAWHASHWNITKATITKAISEK